MPSTPASLHSSDCSGGAANIENREFWPLSFSSFMRCAESAVVSSCSNSARRDAPNNQYYWRVTQFLMPTYTMIPSTPGNSLVTSPRFAATDPPS